MKKIVLATGNDHKTEEFNDLFADSEFKILSAVKFGGMPEVIEDGNTFQSNAYLKAYALSKQIDKKHWVIADDSGLEVDHLAGAPGIYSARYAGVGASDIENMDKLLKNLKGLSKSERRARFRCVLCLIDKDSGTYYFEGICEGKIGLKPKGKFGFGYDPIFIPDGHKASFAELGESIKSQLSHRARAVLACKQFFKKKL
jgi:XTP/dITP diphosphohydrolase